MEIKSSFKHSPAKRSKSEVHQMLKQKLADREARLEAEREAAAQAKISEGAKAAANANEKVMRVDPDKSAIGLNDPNSPATKEKLKAALKSGAVNFNPNERKVLAKILNESV